MAAPCGSQPSRASRPAGGLPVGTEPSCGGKIEVGKEKIWRLSFMLQATSGLCATREGTTKPDLAYSLTDKAVISVPTATVFPGTQQQELSFSHPKVFLCHSMAWMKIPHLDEVFFPQMASPMTFQSWPPSEHRALRTKGSCSPPTVRTAASSSLSRCHILKIWFEVEVQQLFVKVARRLVFIYKGDGGGGKERLRFKLKLSLNK